MKLVPTRPVTIHAERCDARWFPYLFKHTDGSLLLYIAYGYDAHFAPVFRMRSTDNGKTWEGRIDNTPRVGWAHSFPDGELLEMDTYGILDRKIPDTYCFYGAWSHPQYANDVPRKELIRVHAPSFKAVGLADMHGHGYPAYHWWPIFNSLAGKEIVDPGEVFIGGGCFTSGVITASGRFLALGYGAHKRDPKNKYSIICFESKDQGKTWEELALVAQEPSFPEGPCEASLVQLRTGQLYTVFRTGDLLHHSWSEDNGETWTKPAPVTLIDSDIKPRMVWPIIKQLADGSLVMVYGRPAKHMVFDPTGTGNKWQGHLDLHKLEMETQAFFGVPEELRLRGDTNQCIRYWDSSDYLGLEVIGPREMLVVYDVQNYVENWNALPINGIRMVKVELEQARENG